MRGRRWDQESGATAVEYGLVVAAVGTAFVFAGPLLWDAFLTFLNVVLDGMVGP